jgi:hypothetical protein
MARAVLRVDNGLAHPGGVGATREVGVSTRSEDIDMPTSSRPLGVYTKASFILGIAAALWLAWYCAASAAMANPPEAPRKQQHRTLMQPAGLESGKSINPGFDSVRARLERLSEREMKLFYSRCSQEGLSRRLDGGEAMACSIGYDVLLKKHFAGDFERLLHWSRSQRAAETR